MKKLTFTWSSKTPTATRFSVVGQDGSVPLRFLHEVGRRAPDHLAETCEHLAAPARGNF